MSHLIIFYILYESGNKSPQRRKAKEYKLKLELKYWFVNSIRNCKDYKRRWWNFYFRGCTPRLPTFCKFLNAIQSLSTEAPVSLNWILNIKNPQGHWFSSVLIILNFRKAGNMKNDVSEVPVHFKAHGTAAATLLLCIHFWSSRKVAWKERILFHPPTIYFSLETLTGQSLPELRCWSHVNCTLAMAVDQGGISTVAQQEGADLHTILGSSLVQWSELPEVHSIHTGTMLAQQKKPWISTKSSSKLKSLQMFILL